MRTAVARHRITKATDPTELRRLAQQQIDDEAARTAPRQPMFDLSPEVCTGSHAEIEPGPRDRLAHALPCPGCGWTIWPACWNPHGVHVLPPHTIDALTITEEPTR